MKKTLLLLALVSLSGCAYYVADHKGQDGTVDHTSFTTFLNMGKASKVRGTTKDGGYSRSISVGEISGQGDSEMLKTVFEAGMEAGKKSMVP